MPHTLSSLPGNFTTAATSIEAFEFEDGSGDYAGLFVPSRSLAVTGPGTAPITRPGGKRGKCASFANAGSQWLQDDFDSSWNALSADENYLAVAFWYRRTITNTHDFVGCAGGSGTRQWWIQLDQTFTCGIANSSNTNAYIDSLVASATNIWHFICAQFYYDGIGPGVNLKLWVDGVDYSSSPGVSGDPAIIPNPAPDPFKVGAGFGSISADMKIDQLVLWKSGTAWLDDESIAALYNNGAGIRFPPGRESLRERERDRGLSLAW